MPSWISLKNETIDLSQCIANFSACECMSWPAEIRHPGMTHFVLVLEYTARSSDSHVEGSSHTRSSASEWKRSFAHTNVLLSRSLVKILCVCLCVSVCAHGHTCTYKSVLTVMYM